MTMSGPPETVASSVLVIGCGNMGAAIAGAAEAAFSGIKITVVDPDIANVGRLLPPRTAIRKMASLAHLAGEHFDLAIIAVKPHHIEAGIAEAKRSLEGALIVSIAAGISLKSLSLVAPKGARIVRAMPNLPATVRAAMTLGYCGEDQLCERDRRTVERLFEALGRFRWLDSEDQIDVATGVSGSGPGYVFSFVEHLMLSGMRLGLSADIANELARQTVIGAARMLEHDPRSPHEMKRAVTSPGGTTAAALAVLESDAGFPKCLADATAAAVSRARELSKSNK
jgi:pyrroline-5-carboxylate reductase